MSLKQYRITSMGLFAHSSSILLASTSNFFISSLSGQIRAVTKRSDSRSGLSVWRACHHASIGTLPAILHVRFWPRLGIVLLEFSFNGTRPQPNSSGLSPFPTRCSVLSRILGRSKLSMLYPVITSGSCSLTNLQIGFRMSSISSP